MMAYLFVEPAAFIEGNGWPALLLALAVKSVFMLGLATLIAFALRRAAAASRHLVWSLAIVGLLALPLLSLALPAWQWSVLPDGLLALASPAASQAARLIEKPAARADVVSPAMRRGAGEATPPRGA